MVKSFVMLVLFVLLYFFMVVVMSIQDNTSKVFSDRPRYQRGRMRHAQQIVHRQHIYIATVVCDKPSGKLAMLFKVLLYSIVHHKSVNTKITLMVVYDVILTPQPEVLLCDDEELGSITKDFISYLSTFDVVVEFYPTVVNEFADQYGRCASSKLWMHDILPNVNASIVLDADTIFLENPLHLWDVFFNATAFNETVIYGMVSEQHSLNINSGVILLNLTRARLVDMTSKWLKIFYHVPSYSKFIFFDQDMLRIYLEQNPDHLYFLPCKWNQRFDGMFHGDGTEGETNYIGNDCRDLSIPVNRGLVHGNNNMFVAKSLNHFHARLHNAAQYQRAAFFMYLSSIKNHPNWCMKNSNFSQYDVKIEIGKYGRPPLSRMEEYGFWFLHKGGLYVVIASTLGIVVLGCIIVRLVCCVVVRLPFVRLPFVLSHRPTPSPHQKTIERFDFI